MTRYTMDQWQVSIDMSFKKSKVEVIRVLHEGAKISEVYLIFLFPYEGILLNATLQELAMKEVKLVQFQNHGA